MVLSSGIKSNLFKAKLVILLLTVCLVKTLKQQLRNSRLLLASLALLASTSLFAYEPENTECIAPADPGGGWDFTCRQVGKTMQDIKAIPGTLQVTNMSGGGGGVAFAAVVNKRNDDNDLIVAASSATAAVGCRSGRRVCAHQHAALHPPSVIASPSQPPSIAHS